MFALSMGIMAYNEESNIDRLLQAISEQIIPGASLIEIIVVASGCTDRTEELTRAAAASDSRIALLTQPTREGKASAINLFISRATGDIVILESADTVPLPGTIEKLVAPFLDPEVGMTGAHPVPVNGRETLVGFAVNLMWSLHHQIALISPKLGELVAFRNIIPEIPSDSAVDEASIEVAIRDLGYKLIYVPDAVVRNKGPETIRDFLTQRRRISAGHRYLSSRSDYQVSTYHSTRIFTVLLKQHTWKLRETLLTICAISLEALGRLLGYYDYHIRKRNPFIWDIAQTTKKLR